MTNTTLNTTTSLPTSNVTIIPEPIFNPERIAWLIVAIACIITNSILLGLIIFRGDLKKATNSFMASMSAVGILWGALYLLARWSLSEVIKADWLLCSLLPQFGIFLTIIINLHLCLISVDKYIAIIFPFEYVKRVTPLSISLAIGTVWVMPLIVAFLPQMTFRQLIPGRCHKLNVKEINAEKDYLIAVFSILFFVPMACMLVAYGHIFIVANKQLKIDLDQDNGQGRHFIVMNLKAARYLSVIVGVFVITWLPYICFFFSFFLAPRRELYDIFIVFRYLAFCYPIVNPIMYGYFHSDTRREFLKIFCQRSSSRVLLLGPSASCNNSRFVSQTHSPKQSTNKERWV